MARLIGLFGNRSDLVARVVEHEARILDVRDRSGRASLGGWGVGFHQNGEVLIRKRPLEARAELSIGELVHDVRADSVIVHVRASEDASIDASGARKAVEGAENTHPFRYRQWLFAQTGSLPGFPRTRERLLESVPDFLRSQIRGEADAEVLFTVFLSFLHDSGGLDSAFGDGAARALRSTIALADAVGAEFGQPPAAINALLGNGEVLFGLHRGRPMAFREFSGRSDIAALTPNEPTGTRKPDPSNVHYVVLASDFVVEAPSERHELGGVDADAMAGWRSVEPGSLVLVRRGAAPVVESL